MSSAGHDLAIIDFRVGCSFDVQDSYQAALEPRKRMIDQDVIPRHIELEFGDDGATWRHRDRLNALQRLAEDAAQIVNLIEHFPDDVERRGEIRTADAEEDADRFADFRFQRMQLRQGADRAVKDEIFRPLVQQFLDIEFLAAVLCQTPLRCRSRPASRKIRGQPAATLLRAPPG